MNPVLAEIPGAFQLPLLDWNMVRLWVEDHVPEVDRIEAWASIATQWLQKLNESLGDAYQISQSRHLLLFAPRDFEMAEPLLAFGESCLAEIDDALGKLASESQPGPIVVLLFADNSTYGRFVSPFDWEFEYIRSAGVFLNGTYPQIALRLEPIDSLQKTFLHEITHACLAHLTLPQWVEEGITQIAEEAIGPLWTRFTLNATRANEIKFYWREHGLSDFWWGQGFRLYDEGQSHSYQLAQILFRVIAADYRRCLPDFVRNAHADDAGESAAREPAPAGIGTYFWAKFGEHVAKSQNVPVLILNAAYGGTSLEHWAKSASGESFTHPFVASSIRMPYLRLEHALKKYCGVTGLRAILADQGQNDWPEKDENKIVENYRAWIDQARKDTGFPKLAVVVNRQSPPDSFGQIRRAQNRMIEEYPFCFPGPDYDTFEKEDTVDKVHLSEAGARKAAKLWADALDAKFFKASIPLQAE